MLIVFRLQHRVPVRQLLAHQSEGKVYLTNTSLPQEQVRDYMNYMLLLS